ncbi:hypothetical protein DERP_001163 [Dermatophagoides pteronyssinus]|uniref:Uncharacterized protein n=1 Tax=Dermatophagoides pteronyssinus TaxID=6956 RepID=A0ABQ8JE78_DERPT|nr:hypothetical protein DERP_001163 [Dermatophagoides pteronyssinus]
MKRFLTIKRHEKSKTNDKQMDINDWNQLRQTKHHQLNDDIFETRIYQQQTIINSIKSIQIQYI